MAKVQPRKRVVLPKAVKHGTRYAYSHYRCGCPRCTEAQRLYCIEAKAKRHDRVQKTRGRVVVNKGQRNAALLEHGRPSTYDNWLCRCAKCKAAHKAEQRAKHESRVARMRAGSPDVPHGTPSGYKAWGCHCDLCKAAGSRKTTTKQRENAA